MLDPNFTLHLMASAEENRAEIENSKQERMRRRQIAVGALSAVLSIVFFQIRHELIRDFNLIPQFSLFLPLAFAGYSVFAFLILYLRGDFAKSSATGKTPGYATHIATLVAKIHSLGNRIDSLESAPQTGTGQVDPSELAKLILPAVKQQLGQIFEAQYEQKSAKARTARLIGAQFNAAVERLENEIAEQSRKGTVNLAIGVVSTSAAIGLLAYMVLAQPPTVSNWLQLATHYIPRIALAVFIEVFSFFFLRLYKTTLDESRRYNDDLSRLTLQWVAVETGWFADKDGETLTLAKEVLTLTKPPKVAAAEQASTVSGDKLAKAILTAVSDELADKLKKEEKDEKKTKKGQSEEE